MTAVMTLQVRAGQGTAGPAVVGTLLAVLLVAPAPALAHAVLVDSEPGDDEVVQGAPEEIVFLFNEPMQAPATIAVTGPDGEPIGDDEGAEIDGERVRRSLEGLAADGVYTVSWRAVSADDHPISGEFTFEVVDAEAQPEPTPAERATPEPTETPTPDETPTPEALAAEEPAAEDAGGVGIIGWLLGGAVLAAAVATAVAVRASRNQAPA